MNLEMTARLAANYSSPSQRARVITEEWASRWMYCIACSSDKLSIAPTNSRAFDFRCPSCGEFYQLKSGTRLPSKSIPDGSYAAMMQAIRKNQTPTLAYLRYDRLWKVTDLIMVPRFFFVEEIIHERAPLAVTARRSGWVGCNIIWSEIPEQAKLPLVCSSAIASPEEVRRAYRALTPLATIDATGRGWTLTVYRLLKALGSQQFSTADAYGIEQELALIYPDNKNIRPKIRQQLQVIRDLGLLAFEAKGRYRWLG